MGELILNLTKYKFKKPIVSIVVNAAIGHILDFRSEGSSCSSKTSYPGPFFKTL